jgi:hypothetical protein
MIPRKLTQALTDRAHAARRHYAPGEIVHALKNCISIMLLNCENLDADLDHRPGDKRSIETLHNIVQEMNRLVEELAELLGERGR